MNVKSLHVFQKKLGAVSLGNLPWSEDEKDCEEHGALLLAILLHFPTTIYHLLHFGSKILQLHASLIFARCSSVSRWFSLFFPLVFIFSMMFIDFHMSFIHCSTFQCFHMFPSDFVAKSRLFHSVYPCFHVFFPLMVQKL